MFRSEIGPGLGQLGGTPPRGVQETLFFLCHVTVNLNHPGWLMIEILEVNNVNTALNTVTYGTDKNQQRVF